jgi:hypothetical protein
MLSSARSIPPRIRQGKFADTTEQGRPLPSIDRFASHDRTAGGDPNKAPKADPPGEGLPDDTSQSARVVGTACTTPERTGHGTNRYSPYQANRPKHPYSTPPLPDVPQKRNIGIPHGY